MKYTDLKQPNVSYHQGKKAYYLSGTARYKWAYKLECREWSSISMRIASDTSRREIHEHCTQLQEVACRRSKNKIFPLFS